MNWLIDQLTKPQVLSDGSIREPNIVMQKAAKVIIQLSQLFEADKTGRIHAEQKLVNCEEEVSALRRQVEVLDVVSAIEKYKEAMNEDYIRSFT